jgi:hypothetical protein
MLAALVTGALTIAVAAASAGKPGSGGANGAGTVFFPNPVAQLQDQSLTDQKDADYAALQPAYKNVTLTNLDGSGYLNGDYASVVSDTGKAAFAAPGGSYDYNRHDDQFEQVMAYYWVTQAQLYIQSLGFGSTLPAVNKRQQLVRINQYGGDNSFYRPGKGRLTITFGKGGVDDAEDAEVIDHEYGHSVQDNQVPGFGSSLDAGSIGEAFGDYLAVEVGLHVAGAPADGLPAACVADWDSTSYTSDVPHCLRRVDTNLTVADRIGEVHFDGQIWSRALWDIRNALGPALADKIIIDAQFDFAPDTSFRAAALATVAAANRFGGTKAAKAATTAFQARGIL